MKIKKHIQALVFIVFSVLLFFNLSCERQDLFNNAEKDVTDIISPVPGNNGGITASNITVDGFPLTWTAATDNITAKPDLEYSVYVSDSNNIDTLENILNNNVTPAGVWATGIKSFTVTGLTDFTVYYFNVIVRDEAGNISVYKEGYARTADGTPPAVTIDQPSLTTTSIALHTPISINATVSDNDAVKKVEFWIIDKNGSQNIQTFPLATTGVYSYTYSYETTTYTSGNIITIRIVAYDNSGNSASAERTIAIN